MLLLYFQAVDLEGLHFYNLTTKGNFPAINLIVMLIVDAVLYFLLALYFDAVIPAEYGPRKPPYFIFMPSFWKSLFPAKDKRDAPARQMSARVQEASDDIEAIPAAMQGNEAIRYIDNNVNCSATQVEGITGKSSVRAVFKML